LWFVWPLSRTAGEGAERNEAGEGTLRVSAVSMDTGAAQPIAVVTGASSGIGLHTAIGLARTGMRVVMVGRDRARTETARRLVTERSGSDRIDVALADFSRLAEVHRLAGEILAAHDRLDVLVNNAGLFSPRYRLSADGFELTFAVNHLAPFLLTNLLLERLRASAPARIVNVASEAHRRNRIDIGSLTRPGDWTMMRAYGRSKLCNILFTRELARRLDPGQIVAVCLHPGVVATAIGQRGGLVEFGWRLVKPFMISPEKGADTPVYLATVPEPAPFHGGYVIRRALAQPDEAALDSGLAQRLWDESARLVGL
jgi:NAD(P)-dependent dehydrogenase (short-subunit alcohol dehydrogenase family)